MTGSQELAVNSNTMLCKCYLYQRNAVLNNQYSPPYTQFSKITSFLLVLQIKICVNLS
jgi:hypothetical protein